MIRVRFGDAVTYLLPGVVTIHMLDYISSDDSRAIGLKITEQDCCRGFLLIVKEGKFQDAVIRDYFDHYHYHYSMILIITIHSMPFDKNHLVLSWKKVI